METSPALIPTPGPLIIPSGFKLCVRKGGRDFSGCGEIKEVWQFARDATTPDGLRFYCRKCEQERYRRYRQQRSLPFKYRKIIAEVLKNKHLEGLSQVLVTPIFLTLWPYLSGLSEDFEKVKAHFWTRVIKGDDPSDCWLWEGPKDAQGYGKTSVVGTRLSAHQAAFFFTHGRFPSGEICHAEGCDQNCVNPDHLIDGTRQQNAQAASALRSRRSIEQSKLLCSS